MPHTLSFSPDARDAVVAHAREGAAGGPVEVCGVLAGERRHGIDDHADPDRVTAAHRVGNVAADPRFEYELDPAETMATIDDVETRGDDLVGFYHSHPEGPAGPSRTDHDRATWPGYVYCIVSLDGEPTVRAWRWTGEGFVELAVVVD